MHTNNIRDWRKKLQYVNITWKVSMDKNMTSLGSAIVCWHHRTSIWTQNHTKIGRQSVKGPDQKLYSISYNEHQFYIRCNKYFFVGNLSRLGWSTRHLNLQESPLKTIDLLLLITIAQSNIRWRSHTLPLVFLSKPFEKPCIDNKDNLWFHIFHQGVFW